ncbi:MAG: hypothetical protein ABL973_06590 [Micropepsaceae bacterium]
MAKAQFHKNQRVYVKTVGTWATVDKVMPQWAKGIDEPLRVFYDVGLGRDFLGEELQGDTAEHTPIANSAEQWRIIRARNKWKAAEECSSHPYPGTHPAIVTAETDWGGWRVTAAEYDLYPDRIEYQARMITNAPKMATLLRTLVHHVKIAPEDVPHEVISLAQEAAAILRYVDQEIQQ